MILTVRPIYYGWVVVAGLGVTEMVSWGVLVYAFSAFVVPMGAELGWSTGTLNLAYAAGVAVSGLAAVPLGRLLARHDVRWVMTAGSALTVLALLGWSRTSSLTVLFAVWVVAGLAMAATLYEPAFVLTTRWFTDLPGEPPRSGLRARAVLVVTVCGGLASTVFLPLSGALIAAVGWRDALLVLAVVAGLIGIPVHALLLRDPTAPRRSVPPAAISIRGRARPASFRWLALSLAAVTAAKNGLVVVLVAYLVARGYPLTSATVIAGAVGVAQVAGRLLVTAARTRLPEHRTHVAIFLAQALVCVVPLTTTGAGSAASVSLWVFVIVFGLGFGLPELLRGTLVVDLYGPDDFPRLNGILSAYVVAARAAGPLVAGVVVVTAAGYPAALLGAGVLCGVSAVALAVAHRTHRSVEPGRTR